MGPYTYGVPISCSRFLLEVNHEEGSEKIYIASKAVAEKPLRDKEQATVHWWTKQPLLFYINMPLQIC